MKWLCNHPCPDCKHLSWPMDEEYPYCLKHDVYLENKGHNETQPCPQCKGREEDK